VFERVLYVFNNVFNIFWENERQQEQKKNKTC
jgi:hypothetical protein